MFVAVGGIKQWITIRGQNRDNPVVLFLHGGPGTPTNLLDFPFAKAWTPTFTLVQWDQRGAGKTFGSGGTAATDMTIARMAQDGIELTQFLREHLQKDKIIIVGHSWGTILGIHMVKARPDLFYAYVGAGQEAECSRERSGELRPRFRQSKGIRRQQSHCGAPSFRTTALPRNEGPHHTTNLGADL